MKKFIKVDTVTDFGVFLNPESIISIKEIIENTTCEVSFIDGTKLQVKVSFAEAEEFLKEYAEGYLDLTINN